MADHGYNAQDYNPLVSKQAKPETKRRSAMGIGVTTLVTIMVVLLLAAFAILSLVSARSDLRFSEMTVAQVEGYYSADSAATAWYAELDTFAAGLEGDVSDFASQLSQAGYSVTVTDEGELRVTEGFVLNDNRTLMVTVAVNDDTTTTIRQWQS